MTSDQGFKPVVGSFDQLSSSYIYSSVIHPSSSLDKKRYCVRFFRQQLRIGVYEIHRRREVGPEALDHEQR